MRHAPTYLLALASLLVAASALAEPDASSALAAPPEPRDIRVEIPVAGFAASAFGAPRYSLGGAGLVGLTGSAGGADSTQIGGGGRVWASPLDRLTLLVEVSRGYYGAAAPTATVYVRIAGDRARGWAFAGSASYKAEGFAEPAGEVELGALLSFAARSGWHFDANTVFGAGFEDQEVDGEFKLRAGYDVSSWMRVGVDGRGRYRLAGDRALPGGRFGDFIGGPELLFGYRNFFLSAITGPSLVGVTSGVGWTVSGTLGSALFL